MIRSVLEKAFKPAVLIQIEKHLEFLRFAPQLLGDVDFRFDRFGRPSGIVITIKVPRAAAGILDALRRSR